MTIYLRAVESPANFSAENPYKIEIILNHGTGTDARNIFRGIYIGPNLDFDKIGTDVAQSVCRSGLEYETLVIPGIDNESLNELEEVLRLHAPNKIVRGKQ